MMTSSRQFETVANKQVELYGQALRRTFPVRRFARLQHLFDGLKKGVGIKQHQFVEVAPLFFAYFASLQGLQIKPDGGNRSFQFMRDKCYKAVTRGVAADFPSQKDWVC